MARRPTTRYAVVDGRHIAYQVVGSGPVDLVLMHQWFTNIEVLWDVPPLADFVEELATFARVLVYDKAGTGVSDRGGDATDASLEVHRRHLAGVLDAAGLHCPAFVVGDSATLLAIDVAVELPDRMSSLVVVDGFARRTGNTEGRVHSHVEFMRRLMVDGEGIEMLAPSFAGDEEFRAMMARYLRLSASPGTAAETRSWLLGIDVRDRLARVRAPTLILHRRENGFVSVDRGRELAAGIPTARLVELDGADEMIFSGDRRRIVAEIAGFLTGADTAPDRGRPLHTVVFTDIVDSTAMAARVGDEAWAASLREFRAAARRLLARLGGREVNTRGDDLLATFRDPARAIEYALALRDATRDFALETRSGLHCGAAEELDDGDLSGIVVHVGARVAGLTGPGEVVVSRTVADLLAGSRFDFEARGEHELKGVPGSWQLFGVR